MKRIFFLYLFLQACLCSVCEQTTKEITIFYNQEDFVFSYNSVGQLKISSIIPEIRYNDDSTKPMLPVQYINVAVPLDSAFNDFSVSSTKTLIMQNVRLAPAPDVIPTSCTRNPKISLESFSSDSIKESISSKNIIEYVCQNSIGNYNVISFRVCPFEYNSTDSNLYMHCPITININLCKSIAPTKAPRNIHSNNLIKSLVLNKDEVINEIPRPKSNLRYPDFVEYVIITNSDLADSFAPLADWKTQKGVYSKIITTEEIMQNYTGNTLQLKIKNCLYDYATNHDTKYVLLGGDDTIIPVLGCYGKVIHNEAPDDVDLRIPTDLYYACFDGRFDWDGNGNGIYGELVDSISLIPSIYVTRAPVRTNAHVSAFVNKTLFYEKTPKKNGWNNNILMCGSYLGSYYINDSTRSDSEVKSDNLYNSSIAPYWSGQRVKFFDTYTDFAGGENYEFNSTNLQNQLSNGYTFVDINTHGGQVHIDLENDASYRVHNALYLTNNIPTILITSACFTNAFDTSYHLDNDPCLSEAFIRNPNNSVVAYYGCSREGWYINNGNTTLGPSEIYNSKLYKLLFSANEKNYGALVYNSKMHMIGDSNFYGPSRWLQFGLNAIGDPEMPIFTETPMEFEHVSITRNSRNDIVTNTGVPDCRVCTMKRNSTGFQHYSVYNNVSSCSYHILPEGTLICITKQGYVPKIMEYHTYVQNEILSEDKNIIAEDISIGSNVTTFVPSGDVLFEHGTFEIKGKTITLDKGTTIDAGANIVISNF